MHCITPTTITRPVCGPSHTPDQHPPPTGAVQDASVAVPPASALAADSESVQAHARSAPRRGPSDAAVRLFPASHSAVDSARCVGVLPDGTRDILGLWIEGTEGAKFWMRVFNDLKTRGVNDILIAVTDGLKGMPEALGAVFPERAPLMMATAACTLLLPMGGRSQPQLPPGGPVCLVVNAIREVQEAADAWLTDYNTYRPHDSLGNMSPVVFRPRVSNQEVSTSELPT